MRRGHPPLASTLAPAVRAAVAAAALVVAVGAAVVVAPSGAAAADARIHLLHGIPSVTVDVVVDGDVVIDDFSYGRMMDLTALAGTTLTDVELRASDSDTVLLAVGDVALPASGNLTLLAHLTAEGDPTVTAFENDVSELPAGQGRVVFRHGAAAAPVEVRLDGDVVIESIANGDGESVLRPVGTVSAEAVVAVGDAAPTTGPVRLSVDAGKVLLVYVVGGAEGGPLQVLTEVEDAAGVTPPNEVPTGNGPLGGPGFASWQLVAGLGAVGALVVARRRRWLFTR